MTSGEPGAPPEPITRDTVFDLTRMLEQIRNMQVFLARERKEGAVGGMKTISDGFGSTWSAICPTCKQETMEVVRPGKVQCVAQTGSCSLSHCTACGYRHEDGECPE